jgi:hypothetical protein
MNNVAYVKPEHRGIYTGQSELFDPLCAYSIAVETTDYVIVDLFHDGVSDPPVRSRLVLQREHVVVRNPEGVRACYLNADLKFRNYVIQNAATLSDGGWMNDSIDVNRTHPAIDVSIVDDVGVIIALQTGADETGGTWNVPIEWLLSPLIPGVVTEAAAPAPAPAAPAPAPAAPAGPAHAFTQLQLVEFKNDMDRVEFGYSGNPGDVMICSSVNEPDGRIILTSLDGYVRRVPPDKLKPHVPPPIGTLVTTKGTHERSMMGAISIPLTRRPIFSVQSADRHKIYARPISADGGMIGIVLLTMNDIRPLTDGELQAHAAYQPGHAGHDEIMAALPKNMAALISGFPASPITRGMVFSAYKIVIPDDVTEPRGITEKLGGVVKRAGAGILTLDMLAPAPAAPAAPAPTAEAGAM